MRMATPANEPKFVTCPCRNCDGHIEFDCSDFQKGETRTVECPLCKMDTIIFVPVQADASKSPPVATLPPKPKSSGATAPLTDSSKTSPSPLNTTIQQSPVVAQVPKKRTGLNLVETIQFVAWLVCSGGLLVGGLIFASGLFEANGAPQEAAVGAICATIFIGAYVFARIVEKICKLFRPK